MAGPMQGPNKTGVVHTAIAFPRVSCLKQSDTVPGPNVRGPAPAIPVKKRNTSSMAILVENPQAKFVIIKSAAQV